MLGGPSADVLVGVWERHGGGTRPLVAAERPRTDERHGVAGRRGLGRIREAAVDPVVWRFALTSFLVVALVGALLAVQMSRDLRERRLEAAHDRALVTARMLQHEVAMAESGTAMGGHGTGHMGNGDLEAAFRRHLAPGGIPGANLWSADGTLLFGSGEAAQRPGDRRGQGLAVFADRQAEQVLASGEPASTVIDAGGREGAHGKAFVTHVPVTLGPGSQPDAVLELVQDYEPTAAAIQSGLRTVVLALAAGLLALYLLLLPVVAAASARLRRVVAERDEQVRRLREAEQVKNTFLEAVSHELRTPLTAISGMLALLDRFADGLPEDRRKELTARASVNAARLEKLLGDLLDVSRLTRGIVTAHRVPVDLDQVVQRTFADLRIDRPVDVDTRPCRLRVDVAQVERIVENLLANAVKYTPPETQMWVRLEPTGDGVLLTVEDAGPGIPEGSHARIFEPFERAHDRRHAPGTGVGLAIVAQFARMHDGDAWVEDRSGGGASFKVRLRDLASDGSGSVPEVRRGGGLASRPAEVAPSEPADGPDLPWVEAM